MESDKNIHNNSIDSGSGTEKSKVASQNLSFRIMLEQFYMNINNIKNAPSSAPGNENPSVAGPSQQ